MRPVRGGALYAAALTVVTLSGGAALSHQLLWTRRMIDLLGATPGATTRVLGAFFLGLSLGAAAAIPVVRRARRPWRVVAALEGGIALLSVPLLTLPAWSTWLWPALGPERLAGWVGASVRLLLSLLLVLPPALLMGMTLPLFARAALTRGRTLGREGNWLYTLNTAGGVLGLVATASVVLRGFGVSGAMAVTMLANLLLAVAALAIDRWVPNDDDAAPSPSRGQIPIGPLAVAFVSGLSVLAAEVLAVHLFDQVVSLAILGAAAVLVAVILPLAVAAGAGAWLAPRCRTVAPVLATVLVVTSAAALTAPLLFAWQTGGVRYLALEFSPSVAGFLWRALALALGAFGPFILVAGLVLPLTVQWFQVGAVDSRGRRWGLLLAVNGLGGLIGAELADRVLMPALGMHLGFAALGVVYGCAGIAIAARWSRFGHALGLTVVVVLSAAAVVPRLRALPLMRPDAWPAAKEDGSKMIDLETGPEGTVAVVEFGADRVILLNNQYVLGGTRAFIRQQRMALLPAVLHPGPRRVAFIGLGTGTTAGAALIDPAVESVTAIEVSPLVAALSRRYFAEASGDFATSPRAHVVVEDGRIAIVAATRAYDVIVGDLFMPWQVGTGRLYSVEHFRSVRRALAAGGEFCQWLPMFQLTPEQFRVIVASFREAFPQAYLFRDDVSNETPAFALVGYRDATLDWTVVERRALVLRASGRTRDGFVAFPSLVRSLYVGVADGARSDRSVRNTLDNGWIELHAGRDQVGRRWRYLDVETWSTLPEYLADFTVAPRE